MPDAIVTGCLGQDGSYLTEHLLEMGYWVHGVYRRTSTQGPARYTNLSGVLDHARLHLVCGDICDHAFMDELIHEVKPECLFNLAAMSHVGHSFKIPAETMRVNATAVAAMLQSVLTHSPKTKFYQASTSELFGGVGCPEQGFDERSVMNPRSPYAIAKLAAYHLVKNYRERGLYTVNGILFNHSSPRRGEDFATRKITKGVARIKCGLQDKLHMGNLSAKRDVGDAREYVKAMHWLMEVGDRGDDFVVATGRTASIAEMLCYVCALADLDVQDIYVSDPRFMRPSDVPYLTGNASRLKLAIDWEPENSWKEVLKDMYERDLESVQSA